MAVRPRKGFKMTPALKALESRVFVKSARSNTLSHLDLSLPTSVSITSDEPEDAGENLLVKVKL